MAIRKLSYPPVLANGYVYVASTAHVCAVGASTQTAVWSDIGGGSLAVAARRLIIRGSKWVKAYGSCA